MKLLLILISIVTLYADQFYLQFCNDVFLQTDKHFTNGISVGWIDDEKKEQEVSAYTKTLTKGLDLIPFKEIDQEKRYNAGISVMQYMFTPEDINVTYPQYDDFPYVGYLAIDFFLFEISDESFIEYRMSLGVVGEESGAEAVQKLVHKVTGSDEPKGWDTQLGTQYGINFLLRYGEISWQYESVEGWSADWFNHVGAQAGNFIVDSFFGTVIRAGYNYQRNFNVHYPYMKEDASMIDIDGIKDGFGYSFSLGLHFHATAYSYIVDEAQKQGYEIDAVDYGLVGYAGIDLFYTRHQLVLFVQSQTPYLEQSSQREKFGGFSYIYHF